MHNHAHNDDPSLLRDADGACVEDIVARLWGLTMPQALHRAQLIDTQTATNPPSDLRDYQIAKLFRPWNMHRFGYITFHDVELVLRKNGLKGVFGRCVRCLLYTSPSPRDRG